VVAVESFACPSANNPKQRAPPVKHIFICTAPNDLEIPPLSLISTSSQNQSLFCSLSSCVDDSRDGCNGIRSNARSFEHPTTQGTKGTGCQPQVHPVRLDVFPFFLRNGSVGEHIFPGSGQKPKLVNQAWYKDSSMARVNDNLICAKW
jgi:hypothetical protein